MTLPFYLSKMSAPCNGIDGMLKHFTYRAVALARIGLLAMMLLIFGPLVGQLNAEPHSSSLSPSWVCGDDVQTSSMGHHGADHEHMWYEQCEYCSLVQHFPFLSHHIPQYASVTLPALSGEVASIRSAHVSDALFLHAPNRAPPSLYS